MANPVELRWVSPKNGSTQPTGPQTNSSTSGSGRRGFCGQLPDVGKPTVTSLFITALAGRLDRKVLLLSLVLLMIVSGTVLAVAPNFVVFMIGRALLGVAIGGFWSLSAATAMRLVPALQVPRALAVLNGGNALASVLAAPLGSFLGSIIGWRWAFFCIVPVVMLVFV